jgi:ABC-type antimicrobial peptide transport system permease subunit
MSGRVFSEADQAGTLPVAVITEDLATRYFAGADPIGQRIRLGRNPAWPWWTVVGVVPRLSSAPQGDAIMETAFVPLSQAPDRVLTIVSATTADPLAVAPGVRQAIRRVNQDVPTFGLESFAAFMQRRAWPFRVFGTLFMVFGVAALAMAAAGLYGVLAFGVRLRTQEIGVRMALGADRAGVVRMIVRQGMAVVGVGLAAGLTLGALVSPLMSELFFNVTPIDPMVFGTTTGLLLVTGFVASIVPALRAASVDPLVALRES